MSDARRVEKLRRDHAVENFDCGRAELYRYLVRYAWQNQLVNHRYLGQAAQITAQFSEPPGYVLFAHYFQPLTRHGQR